MLNYANFMSTGGPQDGRNPSLPSLPLVSFALIPPTQVPEGSGGEDDRNDCGAILDLLSGYLDNELDADQTKRVDGHLDRCSHCANVLETIRSMDTYIQREWRESTPLPLSSEYENAINDIMPALPPVPVQPTAFTPRRVHARARWIRFTTGLASLLALLSKR